MTNKNLAGRCGIYCGECEYKEQFNCPGCIEAEGKMFWGDCEVSSCCTQKKHEHCGGCESFACDTLKRFAYHPEQGDNGRRIERLKEWNAEGFERWIKNSTK
ncbi:MAG: DUF3795 domain-containing protein [Bacillota bacterium]